MALEVLSIGAANSSSSFKIQKIIVPFRVSYAVESYGTCGAGSHGVSDRVIVENMYVCSELQTMVVVINLCSSCNNGQRTEG